MKKAGIDRPEFYEKTKLKRRQRVKDKVKD